MSERWKGCTDYQQAPALCQDETCFYHMNTLVRKSRGQRDRVIIESCILDVANKGGVTLETIGALTGMTRERVRQIEESALRKLQHNVRAGGIEFCDLQEYAGNEITLQEQLRTTHFLERRERNRKHQREYHQRKKKSSFR